MTVFFEKRGARCEQPIENKKKGEDRPLTARKGWKPGGEKKRLVHLLGKGRPLGGFPPTRR